MDPSIFKAYDIRGVYPSEVHEEVAAQVARGCRVLFPSGKIIVGRDVRIGSLELAAALVKGLRANENYEVIDVGVCSTPLFYFAVNILGAAGGVMVTASHNPSEWNGFKVVGPGAAMTGGQAVFKAIARAGALPQGQGKYETRDMSSDYAAFLAKQFDVSKRCSVVCDFGNGAVGSFFTVIAERFPNITFHLLHDIPDGKFPSRDPNPLAPGALEELKNEVKRTRADLGVAFDADGDRAFFVSGFGEEIPAYVIALLLADGGKKSLVAEVQIFHILKRIGYKGVLWKSRVGTYFMKQQMKETSAEVGAEYSGHYYFREFFGADSGVVTLLNVLEVVSQLPSLDEFLASVPRFYSVEWNVNAGNPMAALEKITEKYKGRKNLEEDTTDGIVFTGKEWIFGVRPSNTEPLLRFFAAASSKETLDELVREIQLKIDNCM